jgi:hypothetical protein
MPALVTLRFKLRIILNGPHKVITKKGLDRRAIFDFGTASQVLFLRLRLD